LKATLALHGHTRIAADVNEIDDTLVTEKDA
jgi:hypothetical protein